MGEKTQHANNNQKTVGISLLILDKECFKTKNVTADKETLNINDTALLYLYVLNNKAQKTKIKN